MAFYIEIEKLFEREGVHYYHALTKDAGGAEFYISIDPLKKYITFYLAADCNTPLKIVDFSDLGSSIEVPGIEFAIVRRVLSCAHRAMKQNEFPQDLSWCS